MIVNDLFKNSKYNNTKISLIVRVKFNRCNNKIGFLTVNDGTNINDIQIVYKTSDLDNFKEVSLLKISSVIKVTGILKETPNNKQLFEILAEEVEILSISDAEYPLQKKEHSNEFLREIAHLRPRTKLFNAVFKIRSTAQYACHNFFFKNNFVNVHSPIITSNDAEGAGESFIVTTITNDNYSKDFFGKKAALTVSGQLNAEAYAQAFKNVYTFSPAFRAENSNTTRHAAEFWMIEPEMAFTDINGAIEISTKLIKYVLSFVKDNCLDELKVINEIQKNDILKKLETSIKETYDVITYDKAIEFLLESINKGNKFENSNIKWGMDLQTEHEKYLCEKLFKKPIYIINYPKDIKSFYMKQNDDNKTVAGFDLLVPGIGELIGGSERESNNDKIKLVCNEKKIDHKNLEWYLNLRKYGFYKSAGFGLGFERLIMYITGISNIRDVIPFPRTVKNLDF